MVHQKKMPLRLIMPFIVITFILLGFTFPVSAVEENDVWQFKLLKKRLIADGFDKNTVHHIYNDPSVEFADKIVSSYFRHREASLNYKQFTLPEPISKARAYLKKYDPELTRAEDIFGVDRTVITAIMLVETRLGTYVGNSNILNTLSTMASLDNHVNRDIIWRERLNVYKLSRKKYDKKALRKAGWAYNELKAFLLYTARENMNPWEINGSYAGAVGIAQFMPSNIIKLAKDGNNDGVVDLFTHADAIASIANYLKRYGWKPGIDRKKAFKVIYRYNHSKYYVNTVLEISDLLKG